MDYAWNIDETLSIFSWKRLKIDFNTSCGDDNTSWKEFNTSYDDDNNSWKGFNTSWIKVTPETAKYCIDPIP